MSVVTLRGNAHLAIPNSATQRNVKPGISYRVESEHPTSVFALTPDGLTAFRAGQDFRYWGSPNAANIRATNHDYKNANVPEMWYLVIVNYNVTPTAVYYSVG